MTGFERIKGVIYHFDLLLLDFGLVVVWGVGLRVERTPTLT